MFILNVHIAYIAFTSYHMYHAQCLKEHLSALRMYPITYAKLVWMRLPFYIMRNFKVALVPGSPRFVGPSAGGYIRLSVATSRKILEEGLDRVEKGLKSLLDNKD
jgi:bifunctional pyridoxal-dependent enzyme with beta-cystathionase and maltose regulon repressor activities